MGVVLESCLRKEKGLIASAPPRALFYDDEYSPCGLDTEFAVPIKEYATGIVGCLKSDI